MVSLAMSSIPKTVSGHCKLVILHTHPSLSLSLPTDGYDFGGVLTNSRVREGADAASKSNPRTSVGPVKEANCLYPGDLYPFTRKPFFLIVDSDNSNAFQHIPRYFGQPFLVLMSPEEAPPPFHDQQHKGSLFTLFLHCPLTAICLISNIIEVPIQLWEKAQQHIDHFLSEAGRLLVHSRSIDPVFLHFYGDDFLRVLILRFLFCSMVSRMHRLFRVSVLSSPLSINSSLLSLSLCGQNRNFQPRSHPPMPELEIVESSTLRRTIIDLAMILDIRSMFLDLDEIS